MGIRVTANDAVAMYDSTTGWAFGPIFECEFDCTNFGRWIHEEHDVEDPRRISEKQLKELHDQWKDMDWDIYSEDQIEKYAPFYVAY